MIHAELGDYAYELYEKKPGELDGFFARGGFDGLNVTIPYKRDVLKYCAVLSEAARDAGSVNTITRLADGSLRGDTTDCFGFTYLLGKTGADPARGKTVVLGSGGSSLTVQAALKDLNAREVAVISRSGADNYKNLDKHRDAVIIVNTTPVGMYPDNGVSPLADLSVFPRCRAVVDLIYNPLRTALLFQAEERGVFGIDGLAMLVAQAKKSAEQFTRSSIPDEKIDEICKKIAQATRNIILIGMPGCGKTGVGAEIAKISGRAFEDADACIERRAGKTIPAIFAEDGEDFFRNLETEILKILCKRSGLVIATGGGAVTRRENRNVLRQNGTVFFLDRDVAELTVSGRPLSEKTGVAALAAERLPLYRQWSDHTVTVRGVEATASDVYARYLEETE